MLVVNEIFRSIQGEGMQMGMYCTFVRLQGCSLHCSFCDSAATWSPKGRTMTIEEIVERCTTDFVVITGGEPTEQLEGLKMLITALKEKGKIVAIESNGTFEHYDQLGAVWVTVSPKPKASYCCFINGINELKYVVTEDFNADAAITPKIRERFAGRIWLQPCDYGDNGARMVKKCLQLAEQDPRLRVGVQLHKLYGVR